jgi:hypothetical protein
MSQTKSKNKLVPKECTDDPLETRGEQTLRRVSDLHAVLELAYPAAASNLSKEEKLALIQLPRALYTQFDAADAVESVLARQAAGLNMMVMDCLQRASNTDSLIQRELELKYATKGAEVITRLVEAFDGHRGRGKQNVTVGNVNVESGGQAVVGNVSPGASPDQSLAETSTPSQRAGSPKQKGARKRVRLCKPDGQP